MASLVGVIVSHAIGLFDFIEEACERGRPLEDAHEAGLVRLRPVLVTVSATVLGLVPLAVHGGPLWDPLCHAEMGGLTIATRVTLVLVPLLYTVFPRDLHVVSWEHEAGAQGRSQPSATGAGAGLMREPEERWPRAASVLGRPEVPFPVCRPRPAGDIFSPSPSLSEGVFGCYGTDLRGCSIELTFLLAGVNTGVAMCTREPVGQRMSLTSCDPVIWVWPCSSTFSKAKSRSARRRDNSSARSQ